MNDENLKKLCLMWHVGFTKAQQFHEERTRYPCLTP